jgi:ribosomal protein S27AE
MKTAPAITRNAGPTFAHVNGSAVRAAPLMCPHCGRGLRAHDIEVGDGGDIRANCGGCHANLLMIESGHSE